MLIGRRRHQSFGAFAGNVTRIGGTRVASTRVNGSLVEKGQCSPLRMVSAGREGYPPGGSPLARGGRRAQACHGVRRGLAGGRGNRAGTFALLMEEHPPAVQIRPSPLSVTESPDFQGFLHFPDWRIL